MKLFSVTMNKELKDLYVKNIKSLKKEIKEISENGNIFHAYRLAGLI
jgi:mRNA-degrading endonuclease RelE of RelBE toxin-antitoxin system